MALYYLHRVDPETPFEESLSVLEKFREAGKIRHVGLSEVGIDQIERAREVVPIAAVQNRYNITERRWEEVVDYCAREGIVFVPFFPLHGSGGRPLTEIAKRYGATPAQITLAWLLRRSPTMLPIPGTLSLDHLRQDLAALDTELSDVDSDTLQNEGPRWDDPAERGSTPSPPLPSPAEHEGAHIDSSPAAAAGRPQPTRRRRRGCRRD